MSDEARDKESEGTGPPEPGEDAPVGDMTEEGQTEVGPYPSLTNVENMGQADLDAVADDEGAPGLGGA